MSIISVKFEGGPANGTVVATSSNCYNIHHGPKTETAFYLRTERKDRKGRTIFAFTPNGRKVIDGEQQYRIFGSWFDRDHAEIYVANLDTFGCNPDPIKAGKYLDNLPELE